ncbi:c-type cytochrome [Moraxella sp.]|uniref:c-type cytochrome n=1 Tax=Moraxella sp. TaxID=479 RepID=UPI00260FC8D3|nr:c-type cytochrome [Moraxella sp.]MCP3897283.1 cytochrome c5 family protein [Moraxella sp.]
MLKLFKIGLAGLILAAATVSHADIADTYNKTCGTCHDSGALNAPKKGDVATWNKLKSEKGMSALVKSTRQGMPRMPAMGLCQKCTNDDFEKLIEHMAK